MPKGPRVVVGMSGGVDSSVAAALLVEQGYDVIGVAMRLWAGEDGASASGCCTLDDFLDARGVASQLGIPFYVMDFQRQFAAAVVDPFVAEYVAGRTPNPCVRCNQFVKFGAFWERARELGATWVATGHYARVTHGAEGDRSQLWRANDAAKDQSYFLFALTPDVLSRTIFPVGDLTKSEVRRRAEALGLSVAAKPESQEVCFAPRREYVSFVAQRAPAIRGGAIVDETGAVVGQHEGIHRFTVGQRRALGLNAGRPLYVTRIDPADRVVHVGPREATAAIGLSATQAVWISGTPPLPGAMLSVKIRSRFEPTVVQVESATDHAFTVSAPRGLVAITPGQAAVLYDGERVVGGGWIERAVVRSTHVEETRHVHVGL
ncbi:MAG: tRNA 2-thiouridine(34) synthase MnmA [Deltaproteobacteria bacterium]|nr:tRNA 2-thiouridine(34) synthase MnmA [Deltaproteobacteria bacterium]